jgi:DNA repair exonuclease SbcCD ATPase subunit
MIPTIKLQRLLVSNLGPYVGDHELELPSHGLHMVMGENLDTDESSGAGKSSFVEAFAYGFDYSTFNATDLQTWDWLTKEPMQVGLDFSVRDIDIVLRRGKKPSLKITGKDTVTSAKSVKEELGRLIGVRPEILKALTYRAQGQPGLFLSMTDQEKKSFLTELLGLQMYETEADRVVKVITDLEQQEISKKAVADSLKAQIPPEPTPMPALDIQGLEQTASGLATEIEAAEHTLQDLKSADSRASQELADRARAVTAQWTPYIENLQVALYELESRPLSVSPAEKPEPPTELSALKKKLELLRQGIAKTKAAHQEKLRDLRSQVADERNEVHRLRSHAQGQIRVATAELERLRGEVAVLETMICDRCKRSWCDEHHTATLVAKRGAIEACQSVVKTAEAELVHANEAEHRMQEAQLNLTFAEGADPVPEKLAQGERDFAQKVADTEAAYRSALAEVERRHDDQVRVLRAEKQTQVAEAKTAVSKAEGDYISALHTAQEMTAEHVRLRESMGGAKSLLDGLLADRRVISERIISAQARQRDLGAQFKRELDAFTNAVGRYTKAGIEHQSVLTKLDQERDYLGVIRSFLGAIFDETLNRVAFLTNERLAKVPNVQGLTLRFISERETKTTKNVRQEIRPIVERDGHEIPLKRTSGGQYTAVELAVDLSLADVISERTGILPGWLILDEAFNGLPVKSKSACLELLKDAAETRLILVIDHATEFKELFDSTIVVRSKEGRSVFA